MTGRKDITATISAALEKHIDPHNDPRIYWAREVTFDYETEHHVRVDYMLYKPVNNTVSGIEKGDFYCYEVKSSVEDFHSKNGHNFLGDFNYYVMPEELFAAAEQQLPYFVGVYVLGSCVGLKCVRKAKRKDREKPVSQMLLMMWRSSRREVVKARRNKKEEAMDNA